MLLRIPTSTDPLVSSYDQRVQLDGREFGLRLRFNSRSGFWFLTLSDVDGNVLVAGRKLVRGAPLLTRSRDPRLPLGLLMVDGPTDPGLTDLALYYLDAAGVAEALA
jgi:hypothetical protein